MERIPKYSDSVREIFKFIEIGSISAVTSMLVITEVLIKPLRERNKSLVNRYLAFISAFPNLELRNIDYSVSLKAAKIRAKHGLKTPDALFIATAIEESAQAFLTNDIKLKKVEGIEIIILEEYVD